MTISIIGSGNVAFHLAQAFKEWGATLHQIVSRNATKGQEIAERSRTTYESLVENMEIVDIVIVAVKDAAIGSVSARIPEHIRRDSIVAHTSGCTPITALHDCSRPGVFYPLQTFSRDIDLDYSKIPFLINGDDSVSKELSLLASYVSSNIHYIDDEQRREVHLAAVMVSNFTNHIVYLAKEHLSEKQISSDIIIPLMQETVRKLGFLSPYDAQTGPARRDDRGTMDMHLSLIPDKPLLREVYSLLSESIVNTYTSDS